MSELWLRQLAHELARPELWDEGVEAARNACVAGASIAAAAITAAAYYDNPLTGIGALRACMARLEPLPLELEAWQHALGAPGEAGEFPPGFGFIPPERARAVLGACQRLGAGAPPARRLGFWLAQHTALGAHGALNPAGLAALCFLDHGVSVEVAERRFLGFCIDTAVAEAQRARRAGLGAIPFLGPELVYEGAWPPPPRARDRKALLERLGLDDCA